MDTAMNKDNFFDWFSDEFLSGRFLKSFIEWTTSVIQTADTSLVLFILVVLPLIVPATPAIVTYGNLLNQMAFTWQAALIGGITIEFLGYAGALLLLNFSTDWLKKKKNAGYMTAIAGASYLFYLVAVVSINVLLDKAAGKSTTYIWVIALLCLLSVPSGLLSATRIMSNAEKETDKKERTETESREDRINRENWERRQTELKEEREFELKKTGLLADERVRKVEARASKTTSNKNNFEAGLQKNTSNPSSEAQKTNNFEAVSNFIEAYLKNNGTLPKTQPIMDYFGISQSGAYYQMVRYLVANGELLVANGIIDETRLEKARNAFDKMPKGKSS